MTCNEVYELNLSYDEVFKYSDTLNPISTTALLAAGKLAQLNPQNIILDLGSGKGTPSLLWSSVFGVQIEGYDLNDAFIEYANKRANLLNLSHRVKYYAKDVKELRVRKRYDVVSWIGVGIVHIYKTLRDGLRHLKTMVRRGGFIIFAEPVWLLKPIPSDVLEGLGISEDSFRTQPAFQKIVEELGFQVKGCFLSSKEDWELYITPLNQALREFVENEGNLATEADRMMKGFKAEYDAVGQYWNMALWVLQAGYS
ncbi:MAG: class I SAM-dependent methyltransferase [Candidatus Bathyarchaeota archaeon]|nr:MAG: class I SAM-dependent methyltransferase [Candidatus Bathyarchaeota archaeon]